jgi:hypothetical protein
VENRLDALDPFDAVFLIRQIEDSFWAEQVGIADPSAHGN